MGPCGLAALVAESAGGPGFGWTEGPLAAHHDVALLDLDGWSTWGPMPCLARRSRSPATPAARCTRSTLRRTEGVGVIDIVRDYAALGIGTAQAGTARIVDAGRSAAAAAGSPPSTDWGAVAAGWPAAVADRVPARAVKCFGVDRMVTRLGLVKRSELNAVLHQVQRLERRLGEVRGER